MKILALTAGLLFGLCPFSLATEAGRLEIGGGPGVSIPVSSEWGGNFKASLNLSAYGLYHYAANRAVGLELGYDFAHGLKTEGASNDDITCSIFQITPVFRISKDFELGGTKAMAYGIFGFGFYTITASYSAKIEALRKISDATIIKLGSNLGGGMAVGISQNMQLVFDFRWHHWHHSFHEMDTVINNLTPSLRLNHTF